MRRLLRSLVFQLRSLFRWSHKQTELDEELQFHIDMGIKERTDQGMSHEAARKETLKEFGSIEKYKEDCRDNWGTRLFIDSLRNARFGMRLCWRCRSSSILAVIVLALGICIATMMFAMSTQLMDISGGGKLNERHLYLQWELGKKQGMPISSQDFKHFRKEVDSLENLMGMQAANFDFYLPSNTEEIKQYSGVRVTPNFFDYVDQMPALGRVFVKSDIQTGDENVVLISDYIWKDFFNRNISALGATTIINGKEYQIIGIMPPGFAFPGNKQLWMPSDWKEFDAIPRNHAPLIEVSGMLKEGFDREKSQAELNTIAVNLGTAFPESNQERTRVRISTYRDYFISQEVTFFLFFGLFVSFTVLLIACANVFHIIMARTAIRSSELALRSSLGAKRSHVIWQVLVDGLILSGIGSILGICLAIIGLQLATQQLKVFNVPALLDFQLQPNFLFFALGAAFFSGIASSIIPAWRASKIEVYSFLKDDSRSTSSIYIGRLSKWTVVSQVTFSAILVFISVFLLKSFSFYKTDFPYDETSVLTASLKFENNLLYQETGNNNRFYLEFKRRIMNVPGVKAVAFTNFSWAITTSSKGMIPGSRTPFELEGQPSTDSSSSKSCSLGSATPDYLNVYGLKIRHGRMIDEFDTKDSLKVCVVNTHFVAAYLNGEIPLGKRLKIIQSGNDSAEWLTIVGVIPSTRPTTQDTQSDITYSQIFVPFTQAQNKKAQMLVNAHNASDYKYAKI
ncbi:MAG: ABC transporter permease, partial [Opitutaceae bacterium]|nr:ABC transporter permease [Opitutaceae bacterium]